MKECFKCGSVKGLDDFYKHNAMIDGHLGKCKSCTKNDSKIRADRLSNDPLWIDKEKERHRDKYHRLNYKDKHKPDRESKALTICKYKEMFPEKAKALSLLGKNLRVIGKERHHWSYKIEHAKDIIHLTVQEHNIIHRFLVYDKKNFMYRRNDNMELLDNKQSHIEYMNRVLNNIPMLNISHI